MTYFSSSSMSPSSSCPHSYSSSERRIRSTVTVREWRTKVWQRVSSCMMSAWQPDADGGMIRGGGGLCQPKGKRVAEKRREGGKRWGWGLGQRAVPDMGVPCRGRGDDRGVSGREGGHRIGTNGERRGGQRAPFRKPCAALAQNRDGWQEPESGRQACAYTDCGQRARRPDVCGMGSRRPRREVGPIRARTAQGERRRAPFRSRSSTCRRGGGRTLWWKQRQTCGQRAPDMCVGVAVNEEAGKWGSPYAHGGRAKKARTVS